MSKAITKTTDENPEILSVEEAKACGIDANKEFVVIYPEWIRINNLLKTNSWTVKQVLFKGFYEDVILENSGVLLRVVNDESGKYTEGDIVGLKIKKWLEY